MTFPVFSKNPNSGFPEFNILHNFYLPTFHFKSSLKQKKMSIVLLIIVHLSVFLTATSTAVSFSYTGADQLFVVPSGVTSLSISITGASGGNSVSGSVTGGRGSLVQTSLTVSPGSTLYINVGGVGVTRVTIASSTTVPGGFNGGGKGGINVISTDSILVFQYFFNFELYGI
jgi:uncharacterized integral membrane protein